MADSLIFDFGQKYQGRFLQLQCTQTKEIANNRSKIEWTLYSAGGTSTYYSTGATTVKINGETVYYKARTEWETYAFPAAKGSKSGTTYVYHDTNGEATITCSIESAIHTKALSTTSVNWTLDSIPRAAVLKDAPDLTDETDSITISFDNIAGAAVSEIALCIGNTSWGVITPYKQINDINATTFIYPIDESDKVLLRKAADKNSITVRYYLRTTIGGNPLFSTLDKTLTIVDPLPVLEPTVIDVGSTSTVLTGNPTGAIIKGFNSIEYMFNAEPQKEASIVSYNLTCGGVKINNDNSNKAYNVESGNFVFSVTDSRGNTVTKNVDLTLIDYVKPSISQSLEMELVGETAAEIKLSISGNYFAGSFGAVNNSLKLEVKHTQNDGAEGEWVDLTEGLIPDFDGNTYTLETTITGLVYDRAYTFICRATDATGETNRAETAEYTIRLIPVFDWGENDFNFNVPISIEGKPLADFIIDSGTASMGSNGTWYWEKWKSGKAVCYGVRNYGNMAVSAPFGTLYSSTAFTQNLPSELFVEPPIIDIDIHSTSYTCWIGKSATAATKDTTSSFYVLTVASTTISQVNIGFNCVGKWK